MSTTNEKLNAHVSSEADCISLDCFVPDITEEEFDALFVIEPDAKGNEEKRSNPAYADQPTNAYHSAVVDNDPAF